MADQAGVDHALWQDAPAKIGRYHYLDGFEVIGFQNYFELVLVDRKKIVDDFTSECAE